MPKAPDVIGVRALGRATLARQLLLARERIAPAAAIERLGALQAQLARPPFVALWSRVDGFAREALVAAIGRRAVVRATLMRATLHLTSARDYLTFRPALAAMLAATSAKLLRDRAAGLDVDALTRAARAILGDSALPFEQLRPRLAAAMKHADARALAYLVRTQLPLVQAADDSPWGWATGGAFALAEAWLERPVPALAPPDALVLRYLAALGPATPADAQTWTGLPALREVFERLRPKLRVFRDDAGRELFDLPRAPRPDPDTPAPPRFLPEWDNLVLGHAERGRVVDAAHRKALVTRNLLVPATFLLDGRVAGTWKVTRARKVATVTLAPFARLPAPARRALEAEAEALARFAEPEAERHAVVVAVG